MDRLYNETLKRLVLFAALHLDVLGEVTPDTPPEYYRGVESLKHVKTRQEVVDDLFLTIGCQYLDSKTDEEVVEDIKPYVNARKIGQEHDKTSGLWQNTFTGAKDGKRSVRQLRSLGHVKTWTDYRLLWEMLSVWNDDMQQCYDEWTQQGLSDRHCFKIVNLHRYMVLPEHAELKVDLINRVESAGERLKTFLKEENAIPGIDVDDIDVYCILDERWILNLLVRLGLPEEQAVGMVGLFNGRVCTVENDFQLKTALDVGRKTTGEVIRIHTKRNYSKKNRSPTRVTVDKVVAVLSPKKTARRPRSSSKYEDAWENLFNSTSSFLAIESFDNDDESFDFDHEGEK